MPRLAWFSPLPPNRSGISQYSRELLPALSSSHQIDLFVDGPPDRFAAPTTQPPVFSAHDFVWKHLRDPYDLVVYQVGNAPCHDYMWAYFVRYPGLVVLHDGQLHHARARQLLQQKRVDDYRSEFRFNHAGANVDLPELAIAGLLGSLTYLWPMLRIAVESARLVVVHNRWLADEIQKAYRNVRIEVVEMGVPAPAVRADARDTIRARHGLQPDAVLFTAFGKVTPEKRISEAIRALAAIVETVPDVHLLLAGETVDYYDPKEDASRLGVHEHVTVAGFVPEEEIGDYLAASDICLCMRWPSSYETSGSWLRCLAAGRATITTDLVHCGDIPSLDPRSWTMLYARSAADATDDLADVAPVSVAVDILDEDHSLRLAMRRLATDHRLRATLGKNGLNLWQERFRLDLMASRYEKTIEKALTTTNPDVETLSSFPKHLRVDGSEYTKELLRQVGLSDLGTWL